jgi:hypothetical protein
VCRLTSGTWPSLPKKAATARPMQVGQASVSRLGRGCHPHSHNPPASALPLPLTRPPPPPLTRLRALLAGDEALKALLIPPHAQRGQPLHRLALHIQQVEEAAPPRQHHLGAARGEGGAVHRHVLDEPGGGARVPAPAGEPAGAATASGRGEPIRQRAGQLEHRQQEGRTRARRPSPCHARAAAAHLTPSTVNRHTRRSSPAVSSSCPP